MKFKRLLTLALIPAVLTACGGTSSLSIDEVKDYIKDFSTETVYPYYRVRGLIDYNNLYIPVDHEFTNDFREREYIPYTRFNPGTFDPDYDPSDIPEESIMNFANGSRAYWTRMPLRVNSKNFHGTVKDSTGKDVLNSTSSYSIIYHYMKSWADSQVKNADPNGSMIMEITKDKDGNRTGLAFYGSNIHSKITIDNYPEYADPIAHPEHWPDGVDYDFYGPFPMYNNQIDATFNFRFEYDNNGWLTREFVMSVNYNDKNSTETQFLCEAIYTYAFN